MERDLLTLVEAIQRLLPEVAWTMDDTDLGTLRIFTEGVTAPSAEEIYAAYDDIAAEKEATQYQKLRAAEYPSIGDQLDALFKAGVFPEAMAAKIQAVKDKYPR
jgi:hypothetical protein